MPRLKKYAVPNRSGWHECRDNLPDAIVVPAFERFSGISLLPKKKVGYALPKGFIFTIVQTNRRSRGSWAGDGFQPPLNHILCDWRFGCQNQVHDGADNSEYCNCN